MTPRSGPRWWRGAAAPVTLAYLLLAVAYTWPLAAGLTHDVPWDLGDSLLNDWILAWHYHQAGRLAQGDWAAVAAWWHPPIFHPSPYAIGYSELLVTQALLGAPIYLLTGNLLLTYNVLFLASVVLSALGAFLLVRELTGDARAGWVAGLLFGFALYRVAQAPHLQVLHAQWAPLVLYGLHRFFAHGRWRAAVGAGLALAAQNLSNGYYLFYLALLLPPYVVVQIAARGRLRDWRAWAGPALAAAVALALTVPLMYPYLQLRAQGDGARPLEAVAHYGADTQAWFTASEALHLWGWMRPVPRAEGELFPGVVPITLAVAGFAAVVGARVRSRQVAARSKGRRTIASAGERPAQSPGVAVRARRLLAVAATASLAWHSLAVVLALALGTVRLHVGPIVLSFSDGRRLLMLWLASLVVLLACSRRARAGLRESADAPVVTLAGLVLVTMWLSFGPRILTGGRPAPSWPDIYGLLYAVLPGGDALRVPPRIAMMTALLMAMLAGIAIAAWRRRRPLPDAAIALLSAAFLAEAWVAPIPINLAIGTAPEFTAAPSSAPPAPRLHPDAAAIAALPADAVTVELPMGSLPYEIYWQYLAAGHWRARVNGYSGGFPDDYPQVEAVLGDLPQRGDEAARLLRDRGVTHVVLHPDAWRNPEAPARIRAWLHSLGATSWTGQAPVNAKGSGARTVEIWRLPPGSGLRATVYRFQAAGHRPQADSR